MGIVPLVECLLPGIIVCIIAERALSRYSYHRVQLVRS